MTATLTKTTLTVDGIRSPILQAGPPHAIEAALFVHGTPGSSQDRVRLVERTGAFARAVAWGPPGVRQVEFLANLGSAPPIAAVIACPGCYSNW